MNGSFQSEITDAILVIGVHREELGFGLRTAEKTCNNIYLMQVDHGLAHKKSLYRNEYNYSAVHREMYLQLYQQLKGKRINLVIDLHTGINESGRCADILSADTHLLYRMKKRLDTVALRSSCLSDEERLYEIIHPNRTGKNSTSDFGASHTIIPHKVWAAREYSYVGLEIYLQQPGDGNEAESDYAVELIQMLCRAKTDN